MKLKDLQNEFVNHIYDKKQNKIKSLIKNSDIPVNSRLQIYRNNVFGNLEHALKLTYEAVRKVVGDDYFAKLCHLYQKQHYSHSGNLDDYGHSFSEFLHNSIEDHKLIYLADLAKLEWLYHLVYFGKDYPKIDLAALQSLKEEEFFQISFNLHPSCNFMVSEYPLFEIWNDNQFVKSKQIKLKKGYKEFLLIERCNLKSYVHKIDESEYDFLKLIQKGENIYQIYQLCIKKNPKFDIGPLVSKFVSLGVLNKFTLNK